MGAVSSIHRGSETAGTLALPGNLGLEWPQVSVIITCYNYARYIEACLGSVQRQDYSRFECIVVDDASTDGSAELVEAYLRKHQLEPRFRLVRRPANGGQLAAFRTGLEQCQGRFIVFVDADDLLLEGFVSAHVQAHLDNFPVAFTSSNQYQINEAGEVVGGVHPDLYADNAPQRVITRCLFNPSWVWATTSSMMFRRAALEAIMPQAGADEHFRRCADNYVCHFANLLSGSILMPEVLGCYRRHGENSFSKNPFFGGRMPTGNMGDHPRHAVVKSTVRDHILANVQRFSSLFTEKGVPRLLAKITPPRAAAVMLLKALFLPNYPMPARMALRLLIMSVMRYSGYWYRIFAKPASQVQFEFQVPSQIPG